ncbi:FusB/FusC family EF-G-binding protein [Alkalihalobacillus oceani]|uniref:FusB/FusC family EF-G-binding protein n=1 Tax=Halalkalibacter oceani TaxID=1653776 RepID=UPI0020418F5A|nr:FusB/FusC family EF-G-binding protein [Halalkalibacter oceani]MCM3761981.1 FusB/FusC family EF-G-binding protein [Halalkalibacter oceani]
MEPFIHVHQYQFIRKQAQIVVNSHANVNDSRVLQAVQASVDDKVTAVFEQLNEEQSRLLKEIRTVEDREGSEAFLLTLKSYVIPFPVMTANLLKKIFPKVKKFKLPAVVEDERKELSYLGWEDTGTKRKFLLACEEGHWQGVYGMFTPVRDKGICMLCHQHTRVGLFMAETKATADGAYVKRGNYICQDSLSCNQHLTDIGRLRDFIEHLNGNKVRWKE